MNFIEACGDGDIKKAKEIFEKENIDIHYNSEFVFRFALFKGHLHIAKWLIEVNDNELAFHPKVAKWLMDIGEINIEKKRPIDIHAEYDSAFCSACHMGDFEIAKWLFEISKEKDRGIIDIYIGDEKPLILALGAGHIDIIKWLLSFYSIKRLKKLNQYLLVKEELQNRKGNNLRILCYVFSRGSKIIDVNAIAIIWKEYLI